MALLRFLPEDTNIDFVGLRYFAFAIDGLLLLISIVSIAWQGFNLGIDFTGGVLMEVKSAQVIDIGKMRGEIGKLGFSDAEMQYFGGGQCDTPAKSCVLIRVQPEAPTSPARRSAETIKTTGHDLHISATRKSSARRSRRAVPRRRDGHLARDRADLDLCRGAVRMAIWHRRGGRHRP